MSNSSVVVRRQRSIDMPITRAWGNYKGRSANYVCAAITRTLHLRGVCL